MALLSAFLILSPTPNLPSFSTRLQSIPVCMRHAFGSNFLVHAPMMSHKRGAAIKMASVDAQEPAAEGGNDQSEDAEDKIPLQNLPLESKLQLKLEQKMKMKIAKKIRLRRNQLLRKRKMRKKGRWPPSKMKKLKNV